MMVCGVQRWQLCTAAEVQIHSSIYLVQCEEPDQTFHPLTAKTPGKNKTRHVTARVWPEGNSVDQSG